MQISALNDKNVTKKRELIRRANAIYQNALSNTDSVPPWLQSLCVSPRAASFELCKSAPPSPRTPQGVRGYAFDEQLGRGAFGAVFAAKRADTSFAVKILDARALGPRYAARGLDCEREMLREVEALSRASHPNVLRLEESFWEDDRLYIVTELLSGGTLSPPAADALPAFHSVVRQLVGAIHYLHSELRLAHGDIKAENVLLDAGGNVRLIDFGSSRPLDDSVRALGGTPAQHPPETSAGRPLALGPADIWALGATLRRLLPQSPPSPFPRLLARCLCPEPEGRATAAELWALCNK